MKEEYWKKIENKKRIVVKVGSSTLIHKETGNVNYTRIEKLVRALVDIKNSGREIILVSSGAIAVGRELLKIRKKDKTMAEKQACAAVGQCELMSIYNKLFLEYGQIAAQILMTRYSIDEEISYQNLSNTFNELLKNGIIPIVNENDAISTDEIEFGENDTLSGIVAAITNSDLLIILSDINGLYTDDPFQNANAILIDTVINERLVVKKMAKNSSDSDVGTGGMYTKVKTANMVNNIGIDMIVTNGEVPNNMIKILNGEKYGTLFVSLKERADDIRKYLINNIKEVF